MSKVRILKAKITDAQAIRDLETRVWGEECTNKYDIPMYIRFGYVFVAKEDEKLLGAICSYRTKQDQVYVCDWFVDEKERGRKVGEKLYKRLISEIDVPIVTFLEKERVATVRAHEKLGFRLLKNVKNAYGIDQGLEAGDRMFVILDKKKKK